MTTENKDSKLWPAVELISSHGFEGMSEALEILVNAAMLLERSRYLRAEPYERIPDRRDYANGFKPKSVKTRLGHLNLSVPQVRSGEFYPSFLEKGLRSERALKLALAEMYVQGVSTRKVESILQEMCGLKISSTEVSRCAALLDEECQNWRNRRLGCMPYVFVDARYEKIRESGRVIDMAVLIAYGIDEQGKREILGLSAELSESEVHWRSFLESLVSRGLRGIKLLISDAHLGLQAARKAVFPSVPWQRCQFHLQQNAQAYVPKKSLKKEVAETLRSVFDASSRAEAQRQLKSVIQQYEKTAPQLSEWIEQNVPEGLTVFDFPSVQRKRLRTSNLAERINKEVRRRTRVAQLFPNVASAERLITAVLMEISEEWQMGKVYLPRVEDPGD